MKLSPFSRFVVCDNSMLPVYKPGDHILTFNWISPKVKDVIVFNNSGTRYLKRVMQFNAGMIYVGGDNKKDSAGVMLIAKQDFIGKVIFTY